MPQTTQTPDPDTFAALLNQLFDTVYPPGRGPFSGAELIRALCERGLTLSAPYLSPLRTGQRAQPSRHTVELIAGFFGIRSEYFTGEDTDYMHRVDDDLRWLRLAHDPAVQTLTTALLELTPANRELAFASVAQSAPVSR